MPLKARQSCYGIDFQISTLISEKKSPIGSFLLKRSWISESGTFLFEVNSLSLSSVMSRWPAISAKAELIIRQYACPRRSIEKSVNWFPWECRVKRAQALLLGRRSIFLWRNRFPQGFSEPVARVRRRDILRQLRKSYRKWNSEATCKHRLAKFLNERSWTFPFQPFYKVLQGSVKLLQLLSRYLYSAANIPSSLKSTTEGSLSSATKSSEGRY